MYVLYIIAVLLISFLRVSDLVNNFRNIIALIVLVIAELVEETKREKATPSRGSIIQQVSRHDNSED